MSMSSTSQPAPAPQAADERRFERHDLAIDVNVTIFLAGQRTTFRGEACNLSRGGMRLFATRDLALGSSLTLEFLIPYNTAELVIRGVVRNRDGYNYGVEFLNPAAHQQQMIERTCNVIKLLR